MKNLIALTCFFSLSFYMWAQNPIITDIYTADPTARVYNNKLYIYPSHDVVKDSTWEKIGALKESHGHVMTDYHAFSTEDMVDFKNHGVIVAQNDVPWGLKNGYGMWAPCITYKDGAYYYYFPNVPADNSGFRQIGLAIATKPEGPFKIEPNYIKGLKGIDPNPFIDDDGQAYMYWGGGKGNSLKVVKLSDDMKSVKGKVMAIENLPQEYKEGPFMLKRNGIYYLTFPLNYDVNKSTEEIAYAIGDNPLGPFEFKGTIMDRFEDQWTNHHSIVKYKGQWYFFYHYNHISKAGNLRSVAVDSLFFNADGTIKKVKPTLRGVGIQPALKTIQLDRYSKINNAQVDFTKKVGIPEWKITKVKPNASVTYNTVKFDNNTHSVALKVLSNTNSAIIELRENSVNGKLIAKIPIKNTKNQWEIIETKTKYKPKGIINIVCLFKTDRDDVIELDWIKFKNKK